MDHLSVQSCLILQLLILSNPFRYSALLVHYLFSNARPNLTKTAYDTKWQDEEAKIDDIACGWRQYDESTRPIAWPTVAAEVVGFGTQAAALPSPASDLRRHERNRKAMANVDRLHAASATPMLSLYSAATLALQSDLPRDALLPQSCTKSSPTALATQESRCYPTMPVSVLGRHYTVCSGGSSRRWSVPVGWLSVLFEAVNLVRLGTENETSTWRQADPSRSLLEIPSVAQAQHPLDDDLPSTLNLDLNLEKAACGNNETSEEGKNAREGLGLGCALIALWGKTQTAFQAVNA